MSVKIIFFYDIKAQRFINSFSGWNSFIIFKMLINGMAFYPNSMGKSIDILKNTDERPTIIYSVFCYAILAMSILGHRNFILLAIVPLFCLIFNGVNKSNASHLIGLVGMVLVRTLTAFK